MTSTSEVIFFGVLFSAEDGWLRVATDNITLAESVAFLQPGDNVQLTVQGSIMQVKTSYHRLVRMDII